MRDRVRIGTRGSPLALRQSELVAGELRRGWPALRVEVVPIRTSGDRLAHANLAAVGGKGLFVKEIEEALLAGTIEVAIHSLKDLPDVLPPGLTLAAFPEREDPRDVLVTPQGAALDALAPGARIGTSSPRRRAQLLARRSELTVEPIRGNVETRLRKLRDGFYDAVILAAAGLSRLGLSPHGAVPLDLMEMLPAAGQGTLGVETREDDAETRALVGVLDHPPTRAASLAERSLLATIGGSCTTALAAHAREEAGRLWLHAFVATPDGARAMRETMALEPGMTPEALGLAVAERLRAAGADEIVRAGYAA